METGPAPFRQGKTEQEARLSKTCMYCGQQRPMSEFRRRTGKRAGPGARRGACRSCRQPGGQADHEAGSSVSGQTNERIERQRDSVVTRPVTARPSASARNKAGRTSHGMEQGAATVAESDSSLMSQPSVDSNSSNDDERADLVTSSPSSSGIRKKRRRRRKSKRSEGLKDNELREPSLEHDGLAGEVGDEPQLGERWRGEEGHSQGHAAANDKGSAQRAGARAAAAVQAAEQAAAAHQALLPAEPQGPAAEPMAADQPAAAKRKRKRRRKRASALVAGAGQARSIAAEAPAPALSDRGDATTVATPTAAEAQPAATGREPRQAPGAAAEAGPPAPVRQPGSPGSKPRQARKERAPKANGEDAARATSGQRPAHASRSHGAGTDGRPRRQTPSAPVAIDPEDPASLRTNRQGMVRMRGKTDKGRRWHQEVDMELAVTLVKEKAAVVVNRYTIRRLFSNKDFKRYILTRDHHTCYFCGSYGDTIDHLLPRAKGGHTTPLNCVCACNLCNQSKAAMDAEEFMRSGIPEWNAAHQAELIELTMQEARLEEG
ncbi:HNH endonuclease [Paenibacillus sp. ClWae2A]|uniref:HNH endonuclease n=1 Tax=Paenibacillus sp. ClWae2A TaxID=3057177 RepID=UPI0028F715EE|nr:HNH endonuclease [Paenibacillus sp. ClWae2A]